MVPQVVPQRSYIYPHPLQQRMHFFKGHVSLLKILFKKSITIHMQWYK